MLDAVNCELFGTRLWPVSLGTVDGPGQQRQGSQSSGSAGKNHSLKRKKFTILAHLRHDKKSNRQTDSRVQAMRRDSRRQSQGRRRSGPGQLSEHTGGSD